MISVQIRAFCTTKIQTLIRIYVSKNKFSKKSKDKTSSIFPLFLIINLDSRLSNFIDTDEVVKKEQIGSGAHGTVWRVLWRGYEYAMKEFQYESIIDEERENIRREIELMRLKKNKQS